MRWCLVAATKYLLTHSKAFIHVAVGICESDTYNNGQAVSFLQILVAATRIAKPEDVIWFVDQYGADGTTEAAIYRLQRVCMRRSDVAFTSLFVELAAALAGAEPSARDVLGAHISSCVLHQFTTILQNVTPCPDPATQSIGALWCVTPPLLHN